MNVIDYTMPMELARRAGVFKTEEECVDYARQRRIRNQSLEGRCSVSGCGYFDIFTACKGRCKKHGKAVSKIPECAHRPTGLENLDL